MDDSRTVDFGTAVQRLAAGLARSNPDLSASARIRNAWERCAGADVLAHTDNLYIVPGTSAGEVVVYVDAQIRAVELNLQAELLRLKLNVEIARMFGPRTGEAEEQVKKLTFRPSKARYARKQTLAQPDADEPVKPPQNNATPVPLTPAELDQLRQQVAHIESEPLRKAAFEAAKANLELLKGGT